MVEIPNFEKDVNILKKWYSKQYHLPQNIDDKYFYFFVSGTNSIEKAKQKIDGYFSLRKDVMSLFSDLLPGTKTYNEACKLNGMAILPGKTTEGHRVILSHAWKTNSDKYNSGVHYMKNILLLEIGMDLWPRDSSYIIIQCSKHVPLSVLKTVNLKHFQAIGKFMLQGMPVKMKKYYLVNSPAFIYRTFNFVSPVLPKKLNERVIVLSDDSVLKEILPMSMLPSEFGGEGKSFKELDAYWTEQIESRRSWFEEKFKLTSDESKRPKDSFQKESLDFGIDGSFKTLNID